MNMETVSSPNSLNIVMHRGSHGGYRAGSGRKANLEKLDIKGRKEIFWEELTKERFRDVVTQFILRAKREDKAAQWLMEQVIGKAAQRVQITGKDGKDLFPQPIIDGLIPENPGHQESNEPPEEDQGSPRGDISE